MTELHLFGQAYPKPPKSRKNEIEPFFYGQTPRFSEKASGRRQQILHKYQSAPIDVITYAKEEVKNNVEKEKEIIIREGSPPPAIVEAIKRLDFLTSDGSENDLSDQKPTQHEEKRYAVYLGVHPKVWVNHAHMALAVGHHHKENGQAANEVEPKISFIRLHGLCRDGGLSW